MYSCSVSSLTCPYTELLCLLLRENMPRLSKQFCMGEERCQLCPRTSLVNQEKAEDKTDGNPYMRQVYVKLAQIGTKMKLCYSGALMVSSKCCLCESFPTSG